MKTETLKLMISITRSKMYEIPEHSDIEGLEGDTVDNFRKISDALSDAEETLRKLEISEEVKKIFGVSKKKIFGICQHPEYNKKA